MAADLTTDVLVVGAGPAGSTAGGAAAAAGVRVLIVDRRSAVGLPVQCAEYIPAAMRQSVNVAPEVIAQKLIGMRTFGPGQTVTETAAPGYTIHRELFDQSLAAAAVANGAELMTGTAALRRTASGEILLRGADGIQRTVSAQVIIGADGPHSTVGQWVGAPNRGLIPGIQVTVPLRQALDHTEIYLSSEFFGGYGWLFPKQDVANVGLGLVRREDHPHIRRVLDGFVSKLVADGRIVDQPLRFVGGWIPAEAVRPSVFNDVLLTGDAAGHTHPITGAGIFTAVTGGAMAGTWAARSVQENNVTLLAEYEAEWRDLFEDTLDRAFQRRQLMESQWDRFDEIIRRCWVAFREFYRPVP